jgi:hypothetical protein
MSINQTISTGLHFKFKLKLSNNHSKIYFLLFLYLCKTIKKSQTNQNHSLTTTNQKLFKFLSHFRNLCL